MLAGGLLLLFALSRRRKIRWRALLLAGVPVVVAAVGLVTIGVLTGFADQPNRPLSDVYEQSAHPLMYVTPGADTTWTHLGSGAAKALRDATVAAVPRAAATNLYLGLSVLLLAVIGLVGVGLPWLRSRAPERDGPAIAVLLGAAVVFTCFTFSLPPTLRGVPMPGLLIHQLAPGLRAGQRFVMPLMAGLSVMLRACGTCSAAERREC